MLLILQVHLSIVLGSLGLIHLQDMRLAGDMCLIPSLGRSVKSLSPTLVYFGLSKVAQTLKNPLVMPETQVWSLGQEDPLEKQMATHSSILAWRIPRTEEPARLQSMGSQRVRNDWGTNTIHTMCFTIITCSEKEKRKWTNKYWVSTQNTMFYIVTNLNS